MLPDNPKPEPTVEDSMLLQAIDAIREEKFARARDILTNLLQTDQQNPDYWVWMSAAMETQKERLYCLQTAFKLDPTNASAKRGLTLMGALPQDGPLQPFPMNHPRPWEARQKQAEEKPKAAASPAFRLAIVIGLVSLLLIGTLIGFGVINKRPATAATQQVLSGTARPTVTPYATNGNESAPQLSTARPLAELMSTPYTPTPIYAATPHGEAAGDSYKGALRAYKNGQWELVGIMMAQVATSQPGSADALYFIGEANRLSGKFAEAVNYYTSAIEVNPNFAPSYLGRARATIALTPLKNVLDDLNKAVEIDPNYPEAYMERGLFYMNKRDLKSAQTDLEHAAKLGDSPQVELNLARVLLAQQENSTAVEAAKRANQMDVTMLDSYLVLGMAYRANGQTEQAVDVLETYLKYQPDNAEAFAVLGAAYYNRGDYATAEKNLTQSLHLNKNIADGYFWLGQTNLALKEYDKALVNYQKARDIDPDSFDVGEGLAKAYMANGEFNNSYIAILKVEKSVVTPGQRARFVYIRALSLDKLNEPDAAFRDWSELLSMPISATTVDMRQTATLRVVALRSPTPGLASITPTRTPTTTLAAGTSVRPSKTPKPTDTRVPTSTPPGTPPAPKTPKP
jgi:tetratricopeptide (TPR) repeat protein